MVNGLNDIVSIEDALATIDRLLGVLNSAANQLESMGERLNSKCQPGHVNYISKASAANIADSVAAQLREAHERTLRK